MWQTIVLAILGIFVSYLYVVFMHASNEAVDYEACKEYKLNSSSKMEDYSNRAECYFSRDYWDADEAFRNKVQKFPNAKLLILPVTEKYNTRVGVFNGNPESFLIHISGTHGAEAFAGSAIQMAWLDYLYNNRLYSSANPAFPTLVIVHVQNPYGFANLRRVNEDNIDLNRNFLTNEEFEFVKKRDPNYSGYMDLFDELNPKTRPTDILLLKDLYGLFNIVRGLFQFGHLGIKRAMVAGNYHYQHGYGFGGFQRSQSANNLIHLTNDLLKISKDSKKIVLVDVHTGLGPNGMDTLLTSLGNGTIITEEKSQLFENYFPTDLDKDTGKPSGGLKEKSTNRSSSNVNAGYELTIGTVTDSFCNNILAPHLTPGDDLLCITQEFGTKLETLVGKYLVDENYAFHYGSTDEKNYYGKKLKNAFYVESDVWRRKIVRRGMAVLSQGFNLLLNN